MGGWVDAVVIVMLMCAYILRPFCAFYVIRTHGIYCNIGMVKSGHMMTNSLPAMVRALKLLGPGCMNIR